MYSKELVEFCTLIKPIKLSVSKNSNELKFKSILMEETSFLNVYTIVPLSLRYYCIFNEVHTIPKCKCCDNLVKYKADYPAKGFSDYCGSECSRANKDSDKPYQKFISDKEWLYEQRITLKKSKELIAEELGCSITPINKWLKYYNIPEIRYNESNSNSLSYLRDYSWMYNEHVTKHRSCEDIGDELSVSKSTVSIYLAKHKIETNSCNSYDRKIVKVTKPTLEIKEFIRTFYDGEIKLNIRNVIGSLELDIYIPEYNLAIEYNGVYSHLYRPKEFGFSKRKDANYHVTKTNLCEKLNIQLYHIFSSSWESKKDIWKSIIKNKFKKTENRIYARNCQINVVSVYEKNIFLEQNHLQGKDKSTFKFGLYFKDELVSLITFGKSRYNKRYDWELIRFCNKLDTNVVGGFSRLLNHFKKYNQGSIISYADRTYSVGTLYEKNGFTLIHTNPPNYYYVKKNTETFIHRSNFTKSKILTLLDRPEWTEEQIMFELEYSKIFDCGTKAYVLE